MSCPTQTDIDDDEYYYIHFTAALSTAIISSDNQATLLSWPGREPDRHEPPGSFGHMSQVGLSRWPMNHPKK